MSRIAATSSASNPFVRGSFASKLQTNFTGTSSYRGTKSFYFFHVPKTGGRTVIRYLENLYGLTSVIHPSRRNSVIRDVFLKEKFVAAQPIAKGPIVGHYAPLSLLRGREDSYYKVCNWRHPARWLLSLYNFRHYRKSKAIKNKFAFVDFRRSMLRNPMTEHLLLYCAEVRGWTYFFMSDKRKFDRACAIIEQFDRFDDIAKVDDLLGFIGHESTQRPSNKNVLPHDETVLHYVDRATMTEIERENAVDFLLHKIALGEQIRCVRDEAENVLSRAFEPRDIVRLLLLPYYRYKTWVAPFK